MRSDEISSEFHESLNRLSGGGYGYVRDFACKKGWDFHVDVQTEKDGLSPGEMYLMLTAFEGDTTKWLHRFKMPPGELHILGWNLYIAERVNRVKQTLNRFHAEL